MTDFWNYWHEHTFLAFLAVCFIGSSVYTLACIPNRICRHFNIKAHGWPPEHLDADGDNHGENDE